MKNIVLNYLILIVIAINPDDFELKILTKRVESKFLKIEMKNNSDIPLIFYYGDYYTEYTVVNQDKVEIPSQPLSIYSGEDYLDYQYDYSSSLIKKTMNNYKLSFKEALMYLHYKNSYKIILPNEAQILDLPIISKNAISSYKIDSTKCIYITSNTTFSNKFLPELIKDSLRKKNILIINPNISLKKMDINISKFFREKENNYIR
ncbi:hypothetical protein [Chryseobacterium jejuense]|uniref:hypothetical protein n=1 Tax=Chryseobacterium jejuense TaxID=445960 RepID=UPI001AE3C486|nr:hypothetical protein [Chryseobacterium jejuense]MBP2617107.1 hypothetical protein [Chryseobacterium jejuense]